MINLLPPEEKKAISQEENWKLILTLEILFFAFLALLSFVLFAVRFYVSGELLSQNILVEIEKKRTEGLGAEDFQKKISGISQDLSKLDSFYQNQISLTEILERISQTLPPGLYLKSISYQKDTLQLGLSGFSPDRDVLLEFKENLEKEFQQEIYFPPPNWVKAQDIDFNVTFKMKQ